MDGGITNQNGEPECEETELDFLAQKQEEALAPMKEDLMEWLAKTLEISISVENFMDVLDSGVHLCQLAKLIHTKAQEAPPDPEQPVPSQGIKFRQNAKSKSWFARDNTSNFLDWCRRFGVKEECLFESEGLVSHKDPRRVVLCLLELARIGAKFGLEPPGLVKLENEIEKEEQTNGSDALLPNKDVVLIPSSAEQVQKNERPQTSGQKRARSSSLDESVRKVRIANNCKCPPPGYQVTRIQEGRYNIGGKIMFVRLLKGRHVMVRVGGGWDTLTHYLCRHDPCKITEYKRSHSQGDLLDAVADDKFLYVKGKYKPK